jgi:hypothetical protein
MNDLIYPYKSRIQKPVLGTQINTSHPLYKGLVSCYLMNEKAGVKVKDWSSSKVDGILNTNIGSQASGWFNEGIQFNDGTSYVDLGTSSYITPTNMTIAIMVNYITPGGNQYFLAKGHDFTANSFGLYEATGAVALMTYTNSLDHLTSTSIIPNNTDTLVVGIIYGSGKYLYINGVYNNSKTYTGTLNASSNTMWLGKQNRASYYYPAYCKVSFMYIWNRVLSSTEIWNLYLRPYDMFDYSISYNLPMSRINYSSTVAKTSLWNDVWDANVAVNGNIQPLEEGYVVVNGEWKKWWPPP